MTKKSIFRLLILVASLLFIAIIPSFNAAYATPSLSLSPPSDPAGTAVTVSGSGFAPSSTVTIKYDNSTVTTSPFTITTDSTGNIPAGVTFVIPASTEGANTVQATDSAANAVTASITVSSSPEGVAYDSGKGEVFVANKLSNTVSVISDSSNTTVATVSVGTNPLGVAYDPAKGEVFVANTGSNSVSIISDTSNTVVATVTVGFHPAGLAYDSGKGE
ncbi:MAG: YncE family protein, partial [Nitrosotalea sp.]